MSLFVCDNCDHLENTALSRFWFRDTKWGGLYGALALCSQCDPDMGMKWHGVFPRTKYNPSEHLVINREDNAGREALDHRPWRGHPPQQVHRDPE